VDVANSATQAVRLIEQNLYDLVLLDIVMAYTPEDKANTEIKDFEVDYGRKMGLYVYRKMQSLPSPPPIAIVSVVDDFYTLSEFRNAVGHLRKHFVFSELTRKIKEWLSESKPCQEIESIQRDQIFICYSHKDNVWLEKLLTMLAPSVRDRHIDLWNDSMIAPGQKWKDEIQIALRRAKVAVLLVSNHFLASDFINTNELPIILKAAEQKQLRVLWIYLRSCLYESTAISEYQAAHTPLKPLEELSSSKQNKVIKNICKLIHEISTKDD